MKDEVARYLKERAEVARSDKQNTTAMDLDEVYSTTLDAFNEENIFFFKNWKTVGVGRIFQK